MHRECKYMNVFICVYTNLSALRTDFLQKSYLFYMDNSVIMYLDSIDLMYRFHISILCYLYIDDYTSRGGDIEIPSIKDLDYHGKPNEKKNGTVKKKIITSRERRQKQNDQVVDIIHKKCDLLDSNDTIEKPASFIDDTLLPLIDDEMHVGDDENYASIGIESGNCIKTNISINNSDNNANELNIVNVSDMNENIGDIAPHVLPPTSTDSLGFAFGGLSLAPKCDVNSSTLSHSQSDPSISFNPPSMPLNPSSLYKDNPYTKERDLQEGISRRDNTYSSKKDTGIYPGNDDVYTHIENIRQLSAFDEERKRFERKIMNLKNIVDYQSKSVSDLRVLTETLRRGG